MAPEPSTSVPAPGFTPGPWKTVDPGHGHATEYLCVQIGADEMYTTLELRPEDARLIAEAPALLALVREAIPRIHTGRNGETFEECPGAWCTNAKAVFARIGVQP